MLPPPSGLASNRSSPAPSGRLLPALESRRAGCSTGRSVSCRRSIVVQTPARAPPLRQRVLVYRTAPLVQRSIDQPVQTVRKAMRVRQPDREQDVDAASDLKQPRLPDFARSRQDWLHLKVADRITCSSVTIECATQQEIRKVANAVVQNVALRLVLPVPSERVEAHRPSRLQSRPKAVTAVRRLDRRHRIPFSLLKSIDLPHLTKVWTGCGARKPAWMLALPYLPYLPYL